MARARLLLLAVVLAAAGPAEARRGDEVVALHPLRGLGVDDATIESLQRIVHNELHGVPGMRLVRSDRVRRHLDRQPSPCDGADPCLAEFARGLDASVAVYGVVGGLGETYTISLKAVNAADAEVRARVDLRVGGAREVLIDGIRAGAYQLLRPDLYVGSLQVEVPVAGAEVYVDGRLVGTTPLDGPVQDLEPGERALKIVKTGFSDFDKFIEVRFRRTSVVTIDLERSVVAGVIYEEAPEPVADEDDVPVEPEPVAEASDDDDTEDAITPPPPDPAPGTGPSLLRLGGYGLAAGGAVALGVGAGYGLSASRQEQALSERFENDGGPSAEHLDDWNAVHATARRANYAYAGGGVLAAVGVALIVADLALPPPGQAVASARITVVPAGPGGLGLTLRVER